MTLLTFIFFELFGLGRVAGQGRNFYRASFEFSDTHNLLEMEIFIFSPSRYLHNSSISLGKEENVTFFFFKFKQNSLEHGFKNVFIIIF